MLTRAKRLDKVAKKLGREKIWGEYFAGLNFEALMDEIELLKWKQERGI